MVNREQNARSAAVLASIAGYRGGGGSIRLSAEQLDQLLAAYEPYLPEAHKHPNAAAVKTIHAAMQQQPARPRMPKVAVITFIDDLAQAPVDEADAYLRLHLLSHRKVQPHGQSLDGVFGLLQNVAWTNLRTVCCSHGRLLSRSGHHAR